MARKNKPSKVKELEGNPGKRKSNQDEPQPEIKEIPDPPGHIGEDGRQEWARITPILHKLGLLTEVDYTALAAYCQTYERWVKAERIINEKGPIIKTTNGNYIQSPLVGIANKALELMHKYLTEFGMTPSSRTRVSVAPQKPKGKFGEYGVVNGGKK